MPVITDLRQGDDSDPLDPTASACPEHWGTWDLLYVRCHGCDFAAFTSFRDTAHPPVGPGSASRALRDHWAALGAELCDADPMPDEFYVGDAIMWQDDIHAWPARIAGTTRWRGAGQWTGDEPVCAAHIGHTSRPEPSPHRNYREAFLAARELHDQACAQLGIDPVHGLPLVSAPE